MPQLTGPEQRRLVELLDTHIPAPDALNRALTHAGMGELTDYTADGPFPVMAANLVAALSRRYQILPFVESVLQGDVLRGSCPPIEQWLAEHHVELRRRAAERDPTKDGRQRWWTDRRVRKGAAAVCVVGFLAGLAWLIVPEQTTITRVRIRVSELLFDDTGRVVEAAPLAATTLTVVPRNLEAKDIHPTTTDAGGHGVIEVIHTTHEPLKVHFLVTDQPASLARKAPLVTTSWGAMREGEGIRILRDDPRLVTTDDEVGLHVIPYSEAPRYYLLAASSAMTRLDHPAPIAPDDADEAVAALPIMDASDAPAVGADGETPTGGGAPMHVIAPADRTRVDSPPDRAEGMKSAADALRLNPELRTRTEAMWAQLVTEQRPVVPLGDEHIDRVPPTLRELVHRSAPSVCYVTTSRDEPTGWSATGVVVADELVLTGYFGETTFVSVGFGPVVGAAGNPVHAVSEVAYHSEEDQVALLRVPGLVAPALDLAAADPMDLGAIDPAVLGLIEPTDPGVTDLVARRYPRLAVIGYSAAAGSFPPEPDAPSGLQRLDRKQLMLGERLNSVPIRGAPRRATLFHDATTAVGTAGSPVIEIDTGLVLGVHLGGTWGSRLKRNYALPIWALLADPQAAEVLRAAGVRLDERRVSPAIEEQLWDSVQGYAADFIPGVELPLPRPTGATRPWAILHYQHFSLALDGELGLARWTASNVDREQLLGFDRRAAVYYFDPRVSPQTQRPNEYYADDEWDRGHLAQPAGVAWGPERLAAQAYKMSYSLANAAPQHKRFNRRGAWKNLEQYVLGELHAEEPRSTILSGPVHAADDPMYRGARIPRRFWMIAVVGNSAAPSRPHVHAWIVSQFELTADGVIIPTGDDLPDPAAAETKVKAIEQATGLDFGPLREWAR